MCAIYVWRNLELYSVVHLYTIPSSVPTRNIVSSFGLNATHLPLSRNYYDSCCIRKGPNHFNIDIIKPIMPWRGILNSYLWYSCASLSLENLQEPYKTWCLGHQCTIKLFSQSSSSLLFHLQTRNKSLDSHLNCLWPISP